MWRQLGGGEEEKGRVLSGGDSICKNSVMKRHIQEGRSHWIGRSGKRRDRICKRCYKLFKEFGVYAGDKKKPWRAWSSTVSKSDLCFARTLQAMFKTAGEEDVEVISPLSSGLPVSTSQRPAPVPQAPSGLPPERTLCLYRRCAFGL